MYASRSRFPKEPYQGNEVVPFVTKEWPAAEDAGPARDLDAEADQRNGRRRVEPSIRSVRQSVKNSQVAGAGPSIGRRMVRRFVRFCIAVLIGVGLTLGWQSRGDEARDTIKIWAPALEWLLPAPPTRSLATPATLPELVQQLGPMTQDLASLRRSVEDLGARQEQMAQAITALQATGQDIRQKLSSPPVSQVPAAPPPRKPPQPKAHSAASPPAEEASPPSPWPSR